MKLKFFFLPLIFLLLISFIFVAIGRHKQDRLISFFDTCTHHFFHQESSLLKGNIKIVGHQLMIDGKPFIMKGICYSPVRKGATIPMIRNPTLEDLAVIEKDFQMMHEAGINTIRTYEPLLDPRILELLTKYQLHTIVPVFNSYLAPFEKVSSIVAHLKNHPSTLIWEVGNEWNSNFFYSKDSDPKNPEGLGFHNSLRLVKNSAAFIKLLDTTHPVSTNLSRKALKDEAFWSTLQHLKSIDLFGLNIYHGLNFDHLLEKWAARMTKPLYLGEFGADAFNTTINTEDDASQEVATRTLITEMLNNLSALNLNHVLIGGCIFEWNDEWWKEPKSSPDVHSETGCTEPGKSEPEEGPYPDFVYNEEWFGIVDIDRNPRPAYNTMKELYSSQPSYTFHE